MRRFVKQFANSYNAKGMLLLKQKNGKKAEACCEDNYISLLITDIFMPEQDGLETISRLQNKIPNLKIIAMSGEGPGCIDTYLKSAQQLGALRSLPKPFKANELLGLVHEMLAYG